jgi:membrane-associated protease RseP (regulator of RpoE activity)
MLQHPPLRWLPAGLLLLATAFTTTTLGALWAMPPTEAVQRDLLQLLTPEAVATVWSDPQLLGLGFTFSLPLLAILLAHELGHFLACRHYRLAATLPYFIPAPIAIGTLGAFIRIRSPLAGRRQLFDVGVAGPLAGFAVLVPFLLWGLAHSYPIHEQEILEVARPGQLVPEIGSSLAMYMAELAFHGQLEPGWRLVHHPFAVAAWVGLLATSLNLIPLGQLDGGHLLYAVGGEIQRRLAPAVWGLLLLVGFYWPGWLIWALVVLILGLRHPRLYPQGPPLGAGRRALAILALVVLVLSFMPVPLSIAQVTG